ncbi:unnamed protein product, partial [Didymodactylos carnosus]
MYGRLGCHPPAPVTHSQFHSSIYSGQCHLSSVPYSATHPHLPLHPNQQGSTSVRFPFNPTLHQQQIYQQAGSPIGFNNTDALLSTDIMNHQQLYRQQHLSNQIPPAVQQLTPSQIRNNKVENKASYNSTQVAPMLVDYTRSPKLPQNRTE